MAVFISRPVSSEWFQAVISEADPTWVTLLLQEISAGDLRHLGTFVVRAYE